jgi:hypothetical protein
MEMLLESREEEAVVQPERIPADANFGIITAGTDTLVFTGGGIDDSVLTTPTCASGTRSATIRPSATSYVIPYTYVESTIMNHCDLVGYNANRYTMGVYVNGSMSSDLYLEAWDDNSFSTTNLDILQGSANSSNESYINAIRTTSSAPPWAPGWDGSDTGAAYLRGTDDRVALKNASSITDEAVYYNIYIRLETDSATFHDTPILGFRYTYT